MISSAVVSNIGGFFAFVEIILSALLGIFILRNFRFAIMSNIFSLTKGDIDPRDFVKLNLSVALGAILLIIPGILTDIIGVILQFEFFSLFLANTFFRKKTNNNKFYKTKGDNDVIDVEVIDSDRDLIK